MKEKMQWKDGGEEEEDDGDRVHSEVEEEDDGDRVHSVESKRRATATTRITTSLARTT